MKLDWKHSPCAEGKRFVSLRSETSSAAVTLGVSIVVCCHNSAEKLRQTLAHLAAQEVAGEPQWEVIVIDNASTDETARVALESWPQSSLGRLRVINEPQLGLSYARWRGFKEARYEFVCFVDDDNWVCPAWVRTVSDVMTTHPEVGACGGFIEEACEDTPPWWFERYKNGYAPGAQGQEEGGDVTWRLFLMGAGLTIRRTAWQQLVDSGFRFLLVGRQGAALTAGEDHELCYALCLAGWQLWYEPHLRLKHFLPRSRLKWRLLRRQSRGAGRCEAVLGLYLSNLSNQQPGSTLRKILKSIKESWYWQILVSIRYLARRPFRLLWSFFYSFEGDYHIIWVERQLGKFLELLARRREYGSHVHEIREAAWRQAS
jgi:glycosyltransferase involved in cell wall biosynthesis